MALVALAVVGSFCCQFVVIVSLRTEARSEQERQREVLECIERKMKNLALRSPRYSRFVPRQSFVVIQRSSDRASATGPLFAIRSVSPSGQSRLCQIRPRCQIEALARSV